MRRVRMGFVALAIGLLFWGAWWLLFRASFLRAPELRITGTEALQESDVRKLLLGNMCASSLLCTVLGDTSLLSWPSGERRFAPAEAPRIASLSIQTSYREKTITATVTEREPIGIWCTGVDDARRCVWFDPDGYAIGDAPHAEGLLVPLILEPTHEPFPLGTLLIDPERMRVLRTLFEGFHAADVHPRSVTLPDRIHDEVRVETSEGPSLLFSLRFSGEEPISALRELVRGVKGVRFSDLRTVDFRVEHRLYFTR
jgi:hypothetical protein